METTVAEFNRLAEENEHGELTLRQAERLVELDGVVERFGGKSAALPSTLKGSRSLAAFGHLIERAEALAERVRLELKDDES